ncbi:hypothetical protein [Pontibacter mangrovi]|uniref:Uncharacterized protein n=1 Tax=Pontibacter mangrovi TaxID=2589816 RepID=A0A501W6P7_9BACT|nr:hypothetical protein [Pontibacter mangrovi]TPE43970.1 hypothetical protein FJM65_11130 [Pontibacter mangrovi]
MEEIIEYLKNEERSYQEGVTLLSRYCKNRMLVNTLSRSESFAHKQKLEHELTKLLKDKPKADFKTVVLGKPEPDPEPRGKTENTSVVIDLKPRKGVPESGANAEYDSLVIERSHLYSERCKLSNTLADAETDEARLEIVEKIEAIEKSRKAIGQKLKHFEEHGTFPVEQVKPQEPELTELDRADLLKKRNNLRSQVSKAKKAVEKKPGDVTKQEKLAKLEVELNTVELQLKQVTEQENAAE